MKYSISLGSKYLLNIHLLCVFISLQVTQNTNESVFIIPWHDKKCSLLPEPFQLSHFIFHFIYGRRRWHGVIVGIHRCRWNVIRMQSSIVRFKLGNKLQTCSFLCYYSKTMEVVTQFCQTRSNVTLKYLGWKFDFIDQSFVDGKQSVAHFKTFGVRELSSVKNIYYLRKQSHDRETFLMKIDNEF